MCFYLTNRPRMENCKDMLGKTLILTPHMQCVFFLIWAHTPQISDIKFFKWHFGVMRVKICAPWRRTPPAGLCYGVQEVGGRLSPLDPDTFCFLSQIPSPVWSEHDFCPTALPTGMLTGWQPAHSPSETYFTFCLFTPAHSHARRHGMQKCQVCIHQCIQIESLLCD